MGPTPTAQLLARKVEDWNDCWTVNSPQYAHGSLAGVYTSHVMLLNWLSMPAFSVPAPRKIQRRWNWPASSTS